MSIKTNRAVFLDRDGVINRALVCDGKPYSPRVFGEFETLPGAKEVLSALKQKVFLIIVVTNQPDISRKLMDREELNKMDSSLKKELEVDDILVCPHDDKDNCRCRKPKPGMLIDASEKWNINLKESYIIGDSWKDIMAGRSAGCTTILLDRSYNLGVESDYRVSGLQEAMRIIVGKGVRSGLH